MKDKLGHYHIPSLFILPADRPERAPRKSHWASLALPPTVALFGQGAEEWWGGGGGEKGLWGTGGMMDRSAHTVSVLIVTDFARAATDGFFVLFCFGLVHFCLFNAIGVACSSSVLLYVHRDHKDY